METSPQGIADIMSHEGVVPFRYLDSVGVDTLGVGHTAPAGPPDPKTIPYGREIPMTEVVEIFRRDLAKFEGRVRQAVKVDVRQHEFDALVSFDFNTGGIHRAKITERLNAGDRPGATAAFDNWHRPPEIIGRRDREKALFATAAYSSRGFANVYPADDRGRIQWGRGRRIDVTPAITAMKDANRAEVGAARDGMKAGGSGAGGVVVGGGGTQVEPAAVDPGAGGALPDLPTDGGSLKVWLVVVGVVLVGIAIAYGLRSARRMAEARRRNDDAAGAINRVLGRAAPAGEPVAVPFVGKGEGD